MQNDSIQEYDAIRALFKDHVRSKRCYTKRQCVIFNGDVIMNQYIDSVSLRYCVDMALFCSKLGLDLFILCYSNQKKKTLIAEKCVELGIQCSGIKCFGQRLLYEPCGEACLNNLFLYRKYLHADLGYEIIANVGDNYRDFDPILQTSFNGVVFKMFNTNKFESRDDEVQCFKIERNVIKTIQSLEEHEASKVLSKVPSKFKPHVKKVIQLFYES